MKKGFTLVELLIVMAILAILSVIMTGVLNPVALVNRGYDARRKKDIGRIKVAFEEYFNDNGCYPNATVIANLTDKSKCNGDVFAPWLNRWPCDPQGIPYMISAQITTNNCPHWFKVFTKLQNPHDSEIPNGWLSSYLLGNGEITGAQANFGVSSTNVKWFARILGPSCNLICSHWDNGVGSSCVNDGVVAGCSGDNCYASNSCSPECKVSYCKDNYAE